MGGSTGGPPMSACRWSHETSTLAPKTIDIEAVDWGERGTGPVTEAFINMKKKIVKFW